MPNVGFVRKEVLKQLPDYKKIRDCIEGQRAIKTGGSIYLPVPRTSVDDEQNQENYKNFLARACFYNATGRTAEGLVGQVFQKEIAFDVPTQFEFLQDDIDGASRILLCASRTDSGTDGRRRTDGGGRRPRMPGRVQLVGMMFAIAIVRGAIDGDASD